MRPEMIQFGAGRSLAAKDLSYRVGEEIRGRGPMSGHLSHLQLQVRGLCEQLRETQESVPEVMRG